MPLDQDLAATVLDSLYDGVYLVDRDLRITYWNAGAARLTGYTGGEVAGQSCQQGLLAHVDADGHCLCGGACPLAGTLADGQPRTAQMYLHHRDGYRVPVLARIAPVRDQAGAIVGAVEVFSDNTAAVEAAERVEELQRMALLDPLTDIPNRRYAEQLIGAQLEQARRYGRPFGFLLVDVDCLKQVNDTHGHATGDSVLKVVARTLRNGARPFDVVGRWGGDEFVVAVVDLRGEERLGQVAGRLRRLVEQSTAPGPAGPVRVTVSVGGTLSRDSDDLVSLLERADQLLYQGKAGGRNCARV